MIAASAEELANRARMFAFENFRGTQSVRYVAIRTHLGPDPVRP
ncbi:hypothetical protein OG418_10155 [Streptomyces phaeochromogenes]|nr:hypothetical protein [Streptomyces phaeochromogenes]MCX5598632.1 hypothetical protein [Streptomyces phaeochromogenes]WRZ33879.1 hypothetical protein OG931_42135 [Streptomyces phaeochromogenes]